MKKIGFIDYYLDCWHPQNFIKNAKQYNEICQPRIEKAFDAVKDFLKCCKNAGIKTYASTVTGFDEREINVENCEKIAKELGAEFRNRVFITNGY